MEKKAQLLELLKQEKSSRAQKKVAEKLEDLIQAMDGEEVSLKGEKGEKGDKGDQGERGFAGSDGDDGRDGKDGKDGLDGLDGRDGIDGKDGSDGMSGKDGSPDSADDIRNKLELLQGDERLKLGALSGLERFRNDLVDMMNKGLMSLDTFRGLGIKLDGVKIGNANEINLIQGANTVIDAINNSEQGIDITISSSGGGGSMEIGLPVISSDPNTVLYADQLGNLKDNTNFAYEDTTGNFVVGDVTGTNANIVALTGDRYAFGDIVGNFNHSLLAIIDTGELAILTAGISAPASLELDGRRGSFNLTGGDMVFRGNTSGHTFGWAGLPAGSPDVPKNTTFPDGNPGFSGSGLNDMEWAGYYSNTILPVSYAVDIDSVGNGQLAYSSGSGPFTVGETINSTHGTATAEVVSDDGTTIVYTNLSFGPFALGDTITGSISGSTATIDADSGTPDTFEWSDTNGNANSHVQVSTTVNSLSDGVQVFFGSETGHTLGDAWNWGYTATIGFLGNIDGENLSWMFGDIDNLVKGQHFGLHKGIDPTDWVFSVGDERADFLHINPIDAPSRGIFWLGDHQRTNNGTAFYADDDGQTIVLQTNYLGNQVAGVGVRGGSNLSVGLGDFNGTKNDTYIGLDDQAKTIVSHANAGVNVDAYHNTGVLDIPNLSFTGLGDFNSVTDGNTGNQGIMGVGDVGLSFSPNAALILNSSPTGDVAAQVADINGGGAFIYQVAQNASQNFSVSMNNSGWLAEGSANKTSIGIDDSTQLITFNGGANGYSFPFNDGTAGQALVTDGAHTLSFVTVATTVGALTPGSIPFVGLSGELTENNTNLWWDNSINSMTVGTPTSILNGLAENAFNVNGDFGGAMSPDFLAISVHNSSQYGSSDFVVSNDQDDGTVATGTYGDFGITGSNYTPLPFDISQSNDVYLYSSPHANNLNIFTLGVGTKIRFATEGDSVDEIRASIASDRFTIFANKDVELIPDFTAPNWTATGGWSATGTSLDLVSDAGPNTIEPSTPLVITPGVTYRVVITASGVTGAVGYTLGGESGSAIIDGTITDFIVATSSADLVITGAASATASLSIVSVRALVANTGDLFIEGNLKFGSAIQTTTGANILFADGTGQATFAKIPMGPSVFPMTDYEFANKAYVDANIAGALPLPTSQLSTTGNITLVGEQTIDGTLTSSSVVLVKDQTLPATNGIYTSAAGAWTRVAYYDATAEVKIGTYTFITGGSTNIGKTFSQYLFNPATDTINVDPIGFTQTSVAPTYTASNGVQLTGSNFSAKISLTGGIVLTGVGTDELSVATDNSSIELAADALRVKALGITNAMLAGSIADSKITSLAWSKITSTPTTLSGYGITDAYPLTGNPSGFITASSTNTLTNKSGLISQWTNDAGYLTSLSGAVTSVSGTANRITSSGGATPAIDIASTYVGQSSITTLGTITTGVWNGTTIGVAKGGTGLATLTANNLLVGAGTSSPTFIAPGTTGNVLQSNGTTFVSQAMNFVGLVEEIGLEDSNSSIIAQTYTLSLYAMYGFTINQLKIISQSGTCTAAIQINGTNVTSISSVGVSSTIATANASGANTVSPGDKVTLVITSPSSLVNLQASVKVTRT